VAFRASFSNARSSLVVLVFVICLESLTLGLDKALEKPHAQGVVRDVLVDRKSSTDYPNFECFIQAGVFQNSAAVCPMRGVYVNLLLGSALRHRLAIIVVRAMAAPLWCLEFWCVFVALRSRTALRYSSNLCLIINNNHLLLTHI